MTGKKSLQESVVSFGASFVSEGKKRNNIRAHIIILPGGIMMVDTALDINPGRPVSGPIHCENGR